MDVVLKPSVKSQSKQLRTLFLLTATILFIMARCSGSRVQCRKMLEIVNQSQTLMYGKQNQYDADTTQQLAAELEATATKIDGLNVSDRQLKQIQTRFTTVYRELSQTLNEIGTTLKTAEQAPISLQGRQQLSSAKEQLLNVGQTANQIGKQVDGLMDEINGYCPQ
jgi:predicted nuclease with TOPRIM domain